MPPAISGYSGQPPEGRQVLPAGGGESACRPENQAVLNGRSYSHTAVKLTLQELEAAAGAEGWVDVCKEPEGE